MSSPRPPVAVALLQARISLGFRQEAMATRLGLSRRTLSRWEHGHVVPTLDDRVRMLAALSDAPPAIRTALGVAFGLFSAAGAPVFGGDALAPKTVQATPPPPPVDEAIGRAASWLGVDRPRFEAALLMVLRAAQAHGTSIAALVSIADEPDVELADP